MPILWKLPTLRRAAVCVLAAATLGCADGLFPGAEDERQILNAPLDGLTGAQFALHARGDGEFARVFSPADGLGPIFVSSSCESCHVGDNRGHPVFMLSRFGRPTADGFDGMEADGGPQLQHRAIAGYIGELLPSGASALAHFMAPAVSGLGLLEAVDDSTLLRLADPDDRNGDGISGRASLLPTRLIPAELLEQYGNAAQSRHAVRDGFVLARFGRKARTVDLLHQTVGAYAEDMGITTDVLPRELLNREFGGGRPSAVPAPEASSAVVSAVTFYLRTLRAPPRRAEADADVVEGSTHFRTIGCASCHAPTLRTGRSDIASLDRAEFHPYTDLLLHDMGSELNDGYTEGVATPAEWRTTPLWGLGLAERAQGGRPFYLHDGRARTLRDAIRLHGGEAAASRSAFGALTAAQQERLLAFLRSL